MWLVKVFEGPVTLFCRTNNVRTFAIRTFQTVQNLKFEPNRETNLVLMHCYLTAYNSLKEKAP